MKNRVKDESGDRSNFVVTPLLVWALSDDPYDLVLWNTVKLIAGETGDCFLATEELAILSMMSTGKVSDCRSRLIEKGLLTGELRRDPDYPQPVWHLAIPDIWETNAVWAKQHKSIKAKIDYKSLQRSETKEQKKNLHQVKNAKKEPSPGEGGVTPGEGGVTPGEGGVTPGEGGVTPGEGGVTPGETNKIIYRSSIDPIQIILDPSNPPPPLQDHHGGGGEGFHANGLAKILNGQPPNSNGYNGHGQPATHTSAVARSPLSLAMRTLASEWAGDFANGWASLEADLAGWDDDQVRALLTWLFVWAIDADSQDRTLDPDQRLAAGQRYERHYANVYAGATNRIGLIKSKIKLTVAVPLTDDDAEILERRISERSFA